MYCGLRGRAFEIYCYKSVVKSLNTTGTEQHFEQPVPAAAESVHCIVSKNLWYESQQFWLILRVWLTGGRLSDISVFKWEAALWQKKKKKAEKNNNKRHVTCCYSDRWPLGAMWIADSPRCLTVRKQRALWWTEQRALVTTATNKKKKVEKEGDIGLDRESERASEWRNTKFEERKSRHEARKLISFSEARPDHLGYYTCQLDPATSLPLWLHATVTVDTASPILSAGVPEG